MTEDDDLIESKNALAGATRERFFKRPSWKRQVLALYIDYLVFTAIYVPVAWTIRSAGAVDNWLVALALFAALRAVMQWVLKLTTPGQWALGIQSGDEPTVAPRILERERWWTLAVGTLLVLEGSKNAVRWTQGLPVAPLLGLSSPEWIATAAITLLGAANVAAGLLILRTRSVGALLGAAVLAVEALAAIIHRDDFREWARRAVVARRGLQGLPIREGEVEMMQALTATVLPAVIAVGLILLLAIAARFRENRRVTSRANSGLASQ